MKKRGLLYHYNLESYFTLLCIEENIKKWYNSN